MIIFSLYPSRKNTAYPVCSKKSSKPFSAFTLAEVLIVIGIIGVVANMTIPTLMKDVQEQILLIQFKETYSVLQQAYLQTVQENGTADTWPDAAAMYNNFKPYFRTIKECPDGSCTITPDFYRGLSGIVTGARYNYHFILANGSTIYFGIGSDGFPAVIVDLNGLKKPNQIGYDLFEFDLTTKNNAPFVAWPFYGMGGSSWFIEDNPDTCTKSSARTDFWNGGGCVYWIIKNGNMDYLHRNLTTAEWIR